MKLTRNWIVWIIGLFVAAILFRACFPVEESVKPPSNAQPSQTPVSSTTVKPEAPKTSLKVKTFCKVDGSKINLHPSFDKCSYKPQSRYEPNHIEIKPNEIKVGYIVKDGQCQDAKCTETVDSQKWLIVNRKNQALSLMDKDGSLDTKGILDMSENGKGFILEVLDEKSEPLISFYVDTE